MLSPFPKPRCATLRYGVGHLDRLRATRIDSKGLQRIREEVSMGAWESTGTQPRTG